MVMNVRSYKIAHRSYIVSQLQDPDDIATALSDLYQSIAEDYDTNKFAKVPKSFTPDDIAVKEKHESARLLLLTIDSDALEIIEQWPNLSDQENMKAIYGQERRGKKLPPSPLNDLNTRLSNTKRVVEYMKTVYPLVIKRTYYYENHKLFIDQLTPIAFGIDTDADILLSILFKNPYRRWSKPSLEKALIKKRPRAKIEKGSTPFSDPVKHAIEHINLQISKKHNNHDPQKIILQHKGFIDIDTSLFHVTDRLNRKT